METTLSLQFGFTDKDGKVHKDVTFGKRPTMKDIFALDTDPRASVPTQYNDLIRRVVITKFGTLTMPTDLSVLLALNMIDREDLSDGIDRYLAESLPSRDVSTEEDGLESVRLEFGFEVDGSRFTKVEFGKLLTGKDEVDADKLGLRGVGREAFLLGRQITKLFTEDGIEISGPVGIERFSSLDAADYTVLRTGAQLRRLSFRLERKELLRVGDGEGGVRNDEGDRAE